MQKLRIPIPPSGLDEIMSRYTEADMAQDLVYLLDRECMEAIRSGAFLRLRYYLLLCRYVAARCAKAAAGGYHSSGGGQGPAFPEFYLKHAMGEAFNKELAVNSREALQAMCPHVMGWVVNANGTETCHGCNVTVTTATKYDDEPQIVETPECSKSLSGEHEWVDKGPIFDDGPMHVYRCTHCDETTSKSKGG